MKTYKQLSKAQQRVVDLLIINVDSYCSTSPYYNYQRITIQYNENLSTYCCKPTLWSLIDSNILVKSNYEKWTRYILNPEFLENNKLGIFLQ